MALEEHGSRMITIRTPAPLEHQHLLFDAMETKSPRHYSTIAAANETTPLLRNELPGGAELRWVVFPATDSFHVQVKPAYRLTHNYGLMVEAFTSSESPFIDHGVLPGSQILMVNGEDLASYPFAHAHGTCWESAPLRS
jgi:hypothetical protein